MTAPCHSQIQTSPAAADSGQSQLGPTSMVCPVALRCIALHDVLRTCAHEPARHRETRGAILDVRFERRAYHFGRAHARRLIHVRASQGDAHGPELRGIGQQILLRNVPRDVDRTNINIFPIARMQDSPYAASVCERKLTRCTSIGRRQIR